MVEKPRLSANLKDWKENEHTSKHRSTLSPSHSPLIAEKVAHRIDVAVVDERLETTVQEVLKLLPHGGVLVHVQRIDHAIAGRPVAGLRANVHRITDRLLIQPLLYVLEVHAGRLKADAQQTQLSNRCFLIGNPQQVLAHETSVNRLSIHSPRKRRRGVQLQLEKGVATTDAAASIARLVDVVEIERHGAHLALHLEDAQLAGGRRIVDEVALERVAHPGATAAHQLVPEDGVEEAVVVGKVQQRVAQHRLVEVGVAHGKAAEVLWVLPVLHQHRQGRNVYAPITLA